MGPSIDLTSQLQQGESCHHRLRAAGHRDPATTVNLTMQRSPTGARRRSIRSPSASASPIGLGAAPGTYSFNAPVTDLLLYVESANTTASYYIDTFTVVQLAPPPLVADFEDGTADGWIPRGSGVVLTNATNQADTGTHSLLTTGRTQGFMGPSIDLTSQLTQGATYQVSVAARLVTGTPATTLNLTVQRTPTTGSTAFDQSSSARPSPTAPGSRSPGPIRSPPRRRTFALCRVGVGDGLVLHRHLQRHAAGAAARRARQHHRGLEHVREPDDRRVEVAHRRGDSPSPTPTPTVAASAL